MLAMAWLAWVWVANALAKNPRGDFESGALYLFGRTYAKLLHGARVEGLEHLRPFAERERPGPLIIAANHTAGIDPALVQAWLPFDMRWMMAEDMRHPAGAWFWEWQRVMFVARELPDGTPLVPNAKEVTAKGMREAMVHLKSGGVIGIFPEGGIERPPRELMPFLRGLGVLVARSRAVVVPVVIEGTPQVDPAWASMWTPSRSRVRFMPPIDYAALGLPAGEIAEDLRRRFAAMTGWPLNEDPQWVLNPESGHAEIHKG